MNKIQSEIFAYSNGYSNHLLLRVLSFEDFFLLDLFFLVLESLDEELLLLLLLLLLLELLEESLSLSDELLDEDEEEESLLSEPCLRFRSEFFSNVF